jgi:hypothetical protein
MDESRARLVVDSHSPIVFCGINKRIWLGFGFVRLVWLGPNRRLEIRPDSNPFLNSHNPPCLTGPRNRIVCSSLTASPLNSKQHSGIRPQTGDSATKHRPSSTGPTTARQPRDRYIDCLSDRIEFNSSTSLQLATAGRRICLERVSPQSLRRRQEL